MTDPAPTGCPSAHRHRFQVGGRVAGIALRCPACAPRTATQRLAEARAARERTLAAVAAVAALPAATRARLAADGVLTRLRRQLGAPAGPGSAAELAQRPPSRVADQDGPGQR